MAERAAQCPTSQQRSSFPAIGSAGKMPKKGGKKSKYALGPDDRATTSFVTHDVAADRSHVFAASAPAVGPPGAQPGHSGHPLAATVSLTLPSSTSAKPRSRVRGASYRLNAEDSAFAAQETVIAETWRSVLLQHETDLREMVAVEGVSAPPRHDRVLRVLNLFDGVTRVAEDQSPLLAELLRLFRIEFCRAIFTDVDGAVQSHGATDTTGDAASTSGLTTYFDEVIALRRENAVLSAEVAMGNTREKLAELSQTVEQQKDTIMLLEDEVGRLVRQNEHTLGQWRRTGEELKAAQQQEKEHMAAAEAELQALNVENKDMQLQLFRLRKQVGGGKTQLVKDYYKQMKEAKMAMLTTLFSEGDERVNLLVFLSQLESRVNEALDRYDGEMLLRNDNGLSELRQSMMETVAVLLEEIYYCECGFRRLTRGSKSATSSSGANAKGGGDDGSGGEGGVDETDVFAAMLFDSKIYDNLIARQNLQRRLARTTEAVQEMMEPGGRGSNELLHFPDNVIASSASSLASPPPVQTWLKSSASPAPQKYSELPRPLVFNEVSQNPSGTAEADTNGTTTAAAADVVVGLLLLPARANAKKRTDGDPPPEVAVGAGGSGGNAVLALREEWLDNLFCSTPAITHQRVQASPGPEGKREVAVAHTVPGAIQSEQLLPRLLAHPMEDICSKKFLSAVDVFAGHDPSQQRFLCAVNQIDPAVPIHLPESTNFVRVKYRSTRRPAATATAVYDGAGSAKAAFGGRRRVQMVGQDGSTTEVPQSRLASSVETSTVAIRGGETEAANGGRSRPGTSRARRASGNLQATSVAAAEAVNNVSIQNRLDQWGARTTFVDETRPTSRSGVDDGDSPLLSVSENLRVFRELTEPSVVKELQQRRSGSAIAVAGGNPAATVAFQRLQPLSPNRSPEWSMYQALFGSYRSLTPRALDVATIDQILLRACERHFTRLEYRYDECFEEAGRRATNAQMRATIAERLFRDAYALTDFQEALIDELEARYGYPELVAKTLYEMLCFLDAMAGSDPVLNLYLAVIRGFEPATHIHFICTMMCHLSFSWPVAESGAAVSREDVITVLRYVYRDADRVVRVDVRDTLRDYDMATRSAPLTFDSLRSFLANAMLYGEESLVLYLNGLFSRHCESDNSNELTFDHYESVIGKFWTERVEKKSLVRFLAGGLGFNIGPLLSCRELAWVATSAWSSNLWQ